MIVENVIVEDVIVEDVIVEDVVFGFEGFSFTPNAFPTLKKGLNTKYRFGETSKEEN